MHRPRYFPGRAAQNDPITIDSDSSSAASSDGETDPQQSRPATSRPSRSHQSKTNAATYTQRLHMRNHTREVRHTAQCVLASRELLMLHALASGESVPRTRRRFLAQIIEPDDPQVALDIAFDRKPGTGVGAVERGSEHAPIGAIQGGARGGSVIDVIKEGDSEGWELGARRRGPGNGNASSSPARQSMNVLSWKRRKGKGTTPDPERRTGGTPTSRAEGGSPASPSPSSRDRRERERERRRRWSGAERDQGVRISSTSVEPEPEAVNMDVDVDMDLGARDSLNTDESATPSRRVGQRTAVIASSDDDEL